MREAIARGLHAARVTAMSTVLAMCLIAAGAVAGLPGFAAAPAYADGLTVVASAPASGESKAPASGTYWVQLSNNVASVEANASLVSLRTAGGNKVAASKYKVELPDVQIEFEYRQYIRITVEGLEPGESYVIRLEGDLAAKNGYTLGQGVDIPFTVAARGETAATLAEPEAVAGGSGNGNGTGGGSGSAAASEGGASPAAGGAAAGSQQAEEPAAGSAGEGAAEATEPEDQQAQGSDAGSEEPASADQGEPMPAGAAAAVAVVALLVAAALAFRIRRAGANAPKSG